MHIVKRLDLDRYLYDGAIDLSINYPRGAPSWLEGVCGALLRLPFLAFFFHGPTTTLPFRRADSFTPIMSGAVNAGTVSGLLPLACSCSIIMVHITRTRLENRAEIAALILHIMCGGHY